ncbi:hypothetical protein F441_07841 [Phytophthora nicotianae CJ01A1]|uniref:Uncharacterized protein n=3 Tax=Phytophthora nicotianae TaxID=4792 RepID=W2LAY3_PHYNI|nr:hypothetical protein L915_07702 [Phytophthora nicotianae]ETL41392.1 hypothetical protein L916_07631 [Phytophthora nicotianae]ETL94566.1 hypothetical protein L917_07516 [Phytophthora nicotianae]ETO76769.1 hypothetical protein F444_07919 [Phytophthora nicotianae P1976]ETP17819.1 hypothetical protein F441_07841 [Phytophthora nicotianae CJ01A1]
MGLLRPGVAIQEAKPGKGDYGAAYARRDNAGAEYHGSQKAIQIRYKEFAQACGFQLVVDHFSAKGPGGGNANVTPCMEGAYNVRFLGNRNDLDLSTPGALWAFRLKSVHAETGKTKSFHAIMLLQTQ